MVERRVLLRDAVRGHALGDEEGAQDLVGGAREDVVGAEQVELLVPAALLRHQVLRGGDELLVRGGARVEDGLRALLTFVLHGVEEQAFVVLEDGQDGLAADRGPAAEGDGDLVLEEQLLRLLGEEVPVRGRVDHHGLDLLAHDSALGVDLLERHHADVAERHLADGHGAGQRMENADLDRAGALRPQHGRKADPRGGAEAHGRRRLEEVPARDVLHTYLLLTAGEWLGPLVGPSSGGTGARPRTPLSRRAAPSGEQAACPALGSIFPNNYR